MASTMRPDIERPIARIAEIICEAATCSGMQQEEVEALKQALRDLVAAMKS